MPGKTPAERAALAAQGELLIGVFEKAGFSHIAPDILQPADVFLDRSGENIRARTFLFTDPSGAELCLRPDLTVPACRYHLSHAPSPSAESRYCYLGPAFRFQPEEARSPAEFEQAGVEWFADKDPEAADARTLKLAVDAVEAAGLNGHTVRLGDLGLFKALLKSTPMPERWRRRLMHQFWRPQAFHDLLDLLTGAKPRGRSSISPLIDEIAARGAAEVRPFVEAQLDRRGLQLVGGRSVQEIAARLAEKAFDRTETPLPKETARRIDRYLAMHGSPGTALKDLEAMGGEIGGPFAAAVRSFRLRLERIEELGADLGNFEFSAGFGRNLEYYTGYVFQIETARPGGSPLVIGGGGRYDDMLADIGSPEPVTAVGFALYTERLLAAAKGSRP